MRILLVALSLLTSAYAIDWPTNYIVEEDSESPNGRWAILIGTFTEDREPPDPAITYFVDLKTRRTLGTINDAEYFKNQNHRDFQVTWSPDSSFCLADYEVRFGFDKLVVLEPKEDGFRQTEIGEFVQNSLDQIIRKEAADKETSCCANAYFRILEKSKILVRALGTTNPKGYENQPTFRAFFEGTYSLATGAWSKVSSHSLTSELDDAISTALNDPYFESASYNSAEDEAAAVDRELNEVYNAARFLLPKEQFSHLKSEQIAWLKKRDAINDLPEQTAFVKARIKALKESLWQG